MRIEREASYDATTEEIHCDIVVALSNNPDCEQYVVRTDDDGNATIRCGDRRFRVVLEEIV